MSTTDEDLRIEARVDGLAAVTRLAASRRFGDYVVYERPGEWIFAGGLLGSIELASDGMLVTWAGTTTRRNWSGRPAEALAAVLDSLPLGRRNVYGWIGFEFCAYHLGAEDHLAEPQRLAHLMIPRVEVRITDLGVTIAGDDPEDRDAVRVLLATPDLDSAAVPQPVDIRSDDSSYRARVAAAVHEIERGAFQKVILSRKFDLPFGVDMPATYRIGRASNTPARSFLLDLGGFEAAGFSPELVVSVDERGMVTTEPLAGTRAFGRGAAEDSAARTDLESDPKEIVEHAVSVRTSFAEISAVSIDGTTAVSDYMTVRERGSVQHLASTVQGQLSPNHTSWDALEVLFPSVTASGIPKNESIDAIFRLDRPHRGLYSGAVLAVSPDGVLEATLVLRAVYQEGGSAWLRAGAGIMAQSDPEREFEETCEKMSSVAPYVVRES